LEVLRIKVNKNCRVANKKNSLVQMRERERETERERERKRERKREREREKERENLRYS